jgi:hypothetical protein
MTMTELRGPALTSWAWPFSFSDLTAGLRKYLSDPTLAIGDVRPMTLPFQKPAIGRVRGIEVQYRTRKSTGSLALVVKEPVGSTRIGLAGVGRREVGVYRHLASQLPLAMPKFVAGSPHGDWLILEAISFGRSPSSWTKAVFDDAIDGLIRLHDRFWGLREDLGNFAWLSRPLEGDFDVYLAAATNAIERIVRQGTPASLAGSPERVALLKRLTEQAGAIAAPLRQEMATLLHGDYWPGNIALDRHGRMVVYDWQLTGIGPGILDLLTFVKKTGGGSLGRRFRQARSSPATVKASPGCRGSAGTTPIGIACGTTRCCGAFCRNGSTCWPPSPSRCWSHRRTSSRESGSIPWRRPWRAGWAGMMRTGPLRLKAAHHPMPGRKGDLPRRAGVREIPNDFTPEVPPHG